MQTGTPWSTSPHLLLFPSLPMTWLPVWHPENAALPCIAPTNKKKNCKVSSLPHFRTNTPRFTPAPSTPGWLWLYGTRTHLTSPSTAAGLQLNTSTFLRLLSRVPLLNYSFQSKGADFLFIFILSAFICVPLPVKFAFETLKGWQGALRLYIGDFYCSTSKGCNNGSERAGREKLFLLSICKSVPEDTKASPHTQSYGSLGRFKTEQAEDFASKYYCFWMEKAAYTTAQTVRLL